MSCRITIKGVASTWPAAGPSLQRQEAAVLERQRIGGEKPAHGQAAKFSTDEAD
jgi:hypothetical protein